MINNIFIRIILSVIWLSTTAESFSTCVEPVNATQLPRIQLRAILARNPSRSRYSMYKKDNADSLLSRSKEILEFYGFDVDEPLLHSEVTRCKKKLVISMKLSNWGKFKNESEFVVVDHAYDPVFRERVRLLNPLVIKVDQDAVHQAYPLVVQHVVNGEASEEIINKMNSPDYKGCSTDLRNPTCGSAYYMGSHIPFSEGFCCSCSATENARRQPLSYKSKADKRRLGIRPRDSIVEMKKNAAARKLGNGGGKKKQRSLVDDDDIDSLLRVKRSTPQFSNNVSVKDEKLIGGTNLWIPPDSSNYTSSDKTRSKRQISESGTQIRGGQDCVDRTTPPDANPITYHESAHCLRFSPLWYTVYKLKEPFLSHKVAFEVLEKHCAEGERIFWVNKTEAFKAEVGTFKRMVLSPDTSMVFSYTPLSSIDIKHACLHSSKTVLLVPKDVPEEFVDDYPQARYPAGTYLLLNATDVIYDGDDCDKAGVGYSAFARQPERCEHPQGTCLFNQPVQMWQHDMDKKIKGEPGKYFLENFADVPDDAIKTADHTEHLVLHYQGLYESFVEIEMTSDTNGFLRKETKAQISEMYVDSTCFYQTKITVVVMNTGLASAGFRPKMSDCPDSVPKVWYHADGPLVTIPPQQVHRFRLSLYGRVPFTRFHCSIEITDANGTVVAVRRIRVQRFDRCVCMWHCICACVGSVEGLTCQLMSLEGYHAAGFIGSMPVDMVSESCDDSILYLVRFIGKMISVLIIMHLFLLFFGICKALLGLCFHQVRLIYLHLVCPTVVKQFEDAIGRHKTPFTLKLMEIFYNSICFLVIPGWIVCYLIANTLKKLFFWTNKSSRKRH